MSEYGLSAYAAAVLAGERSVADYYEEAVRASDETSPVKIANWLSGDLFGLLNESATEIDQSRVSPEALARLVALVESGAISAASAKTVLEVLFNQGGSPDSIVEQEGLTQLQDRDSIRPVIEQVLSDNPDQVAAYLGGKTTLSEWFFGQAMKATQGKADPAAVRRELETGLGELEEHPSSR